MVTLEVPAVRVPVFARFCPIVMLPKLRVVGDAVSCPAADCDPVPLRATLTLELDAFERIAKLPEDVVLAVGV
jgi:hypothetical protein